MIKIHTRQSTFVHLPQQIFSNIVLPKTLIDFLLFVILPFYRIYIEKRLDGYAFSQEEGGVVSQSQLANIYDTNLPKPDGN